MTQRTHSDQTEPTPTTTSARSTEAARPALTPPTQSGRFSPDRRDVLRGAVVVAGAGALAACSSPPVATEAPPSSSTAAATSTTPGATSTSAAEAPAPSGTSTAEIPVGGGKVYSDRKVVVTQPAAGEFKAFSAVCTHQGCTVGQVENGQIICPCHSSHFDIATGAPTPDSVAKSPLEARSVTVSGNTFTVS